MKYLFYFILIHSIIGAPQINLYYTDEVSEINNGIQHDCIRTSASLEEADITRQIMTYCMGESSAKFNAATDKNFPNFTFAQLSENNVTSQELYQWSASIDLIERYEFYLNQSTKSSLENNVFYNCTFPRFGSTCQYELNNYDPSQLSLYEFIDNYYHSYEYVPTDFTCYIHLNCTRGYSPACLDWSEICDGKVDCLNGPVDEEHCWQLEMNQCQNNEYRCYNGQCILREFYHDDLKNPDCIDKSDEIFQLYDIVNYVDILEFGHIVKHCRAHEPSFGCEDIVCKHTPLTSSCVKDRRDLLMKSMYSIKDTSIRDECWSAMKCLFGVPNLEYPDNHIYTAMTVCARAVSETCPELMYFPNVPVLFGHLYTAYHKSDAHHTGGWGYRSPYICSNNSLYDNYLEKTTKILFKNTTCFRAKVKDDHPSNINWDWKYHKHLNELFHLLKNHDRFTNYASEVRNELNLYQCINSSTYIPMHDIMNGVPNCPRHDDEKIFDSDRTNDILEKVKEKYYKCEESGKDILLDVIGDCKCDCQPKNYYICEDENKDFIYSRKKISFQTICDGHPELSTINIEGTNETDETECKQWECNNIYTRCDGLWNCPNGIDEAGCNLSPFFNCSLDQHVCISPHTYTFMCLSITKANNGKIDCLGGMDEPQICRSSTLFNVDNRFHCFNHTSNPCIYDFQVCNNENNCKYRDDEKFCEKNRTADLRDICGNINKYFVSNVEKFMCNHFGNKLKQTRKYFTINQKHKSVKNNVSTCSSIIRRPQHQPYCHRGLELRVWLNNSTRITCLCPPSFYGNQCQYQNQRINVVTRFRALSESRQTLFAIVILLIDNSNERIIHSSEQFTYISIRDCKMKFNNYLFYSTRPKDSAKNYSIHIDIYEKNSTIHRGSLLFPINFPFLPVHRLTLLVNIPGNAHYIQSCLNNKCIHGKCIKYFNNLETFCQCEAGWSGKYCNIQYNYTCSSHSTFIGISANNRSICVCPMNKFGSRCLLVDNTCKTACKNGGQCIVNDDYMVSSPKYTCICPKGYDGDRCEKVQADNKLQITFGKGILLTESLFIHFIEVHEDNEPTRETTLRRIFGVRENAFIIHWTRPFHLVFLELLNNNYYLTVIQEIHNESATIMKIINPSDRCPHISELFNTTFAQLHLLKRIKSYHLPCQRQKLNLSCFYDNDHLCLCYTFGQKRLANCFNFHHNMTFDCSGESECENGGKCFQDSPDCPKTSICICPSCYYGKRCQLSTTRFGLSLDAIIGQHILPSTNFIHQLFIVKFSLALTVIFIIAGFIDSILTFITFKNKTICEVGCGIYLFVSSITTLLTMIMFGLKFFILLIVQMKNISNQSFLQIQCTSLDFLLHIGLYMDQWLSVCVAVERCATTIQGTRFNKKKSAKTAKKVIPILLIIIICTNIHDPIHRRLITEENNDDDNDKRIWCTTNYSSRVRVYNSIITTFYFFAPFIINIISAIILIVKKSRQQSNVHVNRNYREILKENFREHKNLLTAPVVLVILAIPRLIIFYISKCLTSMDNPWLYLVGYFISFIPPILTFIVFVLPSKFYKTQCRKTVVGYRTMMRERLHLNS
ncbi:unnamed protein product [Adineta steineri]|uniref:Uncharacterized protein n=2 Tax=Adineta steineri TaxID=433720 RepID=A0A814R7X3_9BILA|nr:unnamed protein product [Adineta steineri]